MMEIAPTFARQLRVAADDPNTSEETLRQGCRDAADVIDSQDMLDDAKSTAINSMHKALQRLQRQWLTLAVLFLALVVVNIVTWVAR